MRTLTALLFIIGLTAPTLAAADDGKVWIGKARTIILSHHLLSRATLRCTALVYGVESTAEMAGISAIEKHGHGCGGDPNTAPRLFTMDIDKKTGRATWDRDDPGTMTPVPTR